MGVVATSFRDTLYGTDKTVPFFKDKDYETNTVKDFEHDNALPEVTYTWNTTSKIVRIAKLILSIIILPIALYKLLHILVGKLILPASSRCQMTGNLCISSKIYKQAITDKRLDALSENPWERETEVGDDGLLRWKPISDEVTWKYKRITLEVDGNKVDAMIMGRASTLHNRRWTFVTCGNGELIEKSRINNDNFKELLTETNSNALVFNYPGVGGSSGSATRSALVKAHKLGLNFLEDEKGVNAKEIINLGLSLGGGVQGDALKTHPLKPGIKYLAVKIQTFSTIYTVVTGMVCRVLAALAVLLGWNLSSVESSRKMPYREIIVQTANTDKAIEFLPSATKDEISNSVNKLTSDGVFTKETSLANALLQDEKCPKDKKIFIGVTAPHGGDINPEFLGTVINASL